MRGYQTLFAHFLFGVVALFLVRLPAHADTYPNHMIKLVVPWPPGGIVDIRSRVIADRLGKALGQQVLVDNRPGASGTLGAAIVAKAPNDGYTLLVGTYLDQAAAIPLLPSVPYDPSKDFVPIAMIGRSCTLLVAHPSLNVFTASELVALIKSKPGVLSYGYTGIGTPQQLLMEKLKLLHKLEVSGVQYKGSGLALPDLVGNHVQMMFDFAPSLAPYINGGKVRALMTGCQHRIEMYPDIPSAREAGFPELDVPSWGGIFAPKGTRAEIVQRLNREINKIQMAPDVRGHLAYAGAQIPLLTPEEFADFIKADRPKWMDIIKAAGIKPE